MSLEFIDGFDHYQTADILKKWTSIQLVSNISVSTLYGRSAGGQGCRIGGTSANLVKAFGALATRVVGAAVNFELTPNANSQIFRFMDGATEQCSVRGDGAGHLTVTRNGTVLATSVLTVSTGTWYYIEFKATIGDSGAAYEVRVNGTTYISGTGDTKNTANATTDNIAINGTTFWIDDLYILNTSGSVNNDFLGQVRVATLRPEEAGNHQAWTPNFGNNLGSTNDQTADGDTSFVQSSTAGQKDTFKFTDLPIDAGTIFGIQHNLWARQDAGAQRTIRPLQRSSATDYAGASVNTAGSYIDHTEIEELDPDTSAAYTVAGLNAAEFGYELVS